MVPDLHECFPQEVVRGGALLPNGLAVGLVGGGVPTWELLPAADHSRIAAAYRQILLTLDGPLDVYELDGPLNVSGILGTLLQRQSEVTSPVQATILGELADRLAAACHADTARAKQVVWVVTAAGSSGQSFWHAFKRLRPGARPTPPNTSRPLVRVVDKARRLADMLRALGGEPAPRLLEPEEIVQLWYRQADPVRARRYPLGGSLLSRLEHGLPRSEEEPYGSA